MDGAASSWASARASPKSGATCRAFVARIAENGETRAVQGDACEKAGGVTLSDTAPLRGV